MFLNVIACVLFKDPKSVLSPDLFYLGLSELLLCAHSPNRSLCARGYPELELGAEPMPVAPGAPGGLKLSNGGNWKGSETGIRPPNIPKPRGRAEGLPRREVPAVDTYRHRMQ